MPGRANRGFTLIEAIVVLVVLTLAVALILPAVLQARENSRKAQCKASLKELGLALHNYESAYKRFPSGGKGTFWGSLKGTHLFASPDVNPVFTPNGTAFDPQSTFTALLPYLLTDAPRVPVPGDLPYNTDQETTLGRQTRAQASQSWPQFRCPSSPIALSDRAGYGETDFAPTVFVDIAIVASQTATGPVAAGSYDPATPTDRRSRLDGLLGLGGTPMGFVTDGTSNTIAIAESVGRALVPGGIVTSPHRSPTGTRETCGSADGTAASGFRCPNRWADPDNALGVSGPPGGSARLLNNHAVPIGGPAECRWSTENCGPNDELFGFHPGGVQVVFADGAVRFLSENTHAAVVARLVARSDGQESSLPCGSRSGNRESDK